MLKIHKVIYIVLPLNAAKKMHAKLSGLVFFLTQVGAGGILSNDAN